MPLPVAIIAGQAIMHGLRIAGLRILPYIIRSKTAKSAAQYATKKVGQKSITETGYVVITKDPTKFKLAQRIFGKNKVFRNDKILQAQSTAEKEIVPLTQKILKSASPEVRTTILNQADDAANGVSKFISSSKVQTVGGTKVAEPFKQFFGKNLKFSDKTVEVIKKAERGPLSLSKEIAKVSKEGVTVGAPKTVLETTKKVAQETAKKVKVPEIKNVPIKQIVKTEKRPWYINIMPKHLRTTKDVSITGPEKIPYTGAPYSIRTVKDVVAKGKLARDVGIGYGLYEGAKYMSRNIDDTDEVRGGIDLNDSDLFETESRMYDQEEIASGINIYDTDEQGNVIQAQ
jgi:predicted transcriptional regulator